MLFRFTIGFKSAKSALSGSLQGLFEMSIYVLAERWGPLGNKLPIAPLNIFMMTQVAGYKTHILPTRFVCDVKPHIFPNAKVTSKN